MGDKDNAKSNIGIYITIGIIIILVILAQIFIVPKILEKTTENYSSDIPNSQSIEYMEISLSDIEKKVNSKNNDFKIMDEVKLDNGLHRLIGQGREEDDRVVLEIIGNKSLDKISSIYLVTWNSDGLHKDARQVNPKYMVELLNIIYPEFQEADRWVEKSLEELDKNQIVKVMDNSQIGIISLDNYETIGLSILPIVY